MGISIKSWLTGKLLKKKSSGAESIDAISCEGLWELAQELRIRELAFNSCVNMIANAVGKCEFQTFCNGRPTQKDEYYLWNFEPNINQNSTTFIHKFIFKLYRENEALIISVKHRDGREMMVVADSFTKLPRSPSKQNEYTDVTVGETTYGKTFRENDVIHLQLNQEDVKAVVDGLYSTYYKLIASAMKNFSWGSGKHLKVHVSRLAEGDPEFVRKFSDIIQAHVKPWVDGESGVLPEYDGYEYSDLGGSPDTQRSTRDIRSLIDDIFTFTANAFGIPPVLLLGDVAGTQDAMTRWMTTCIDPLCDQISEEITRKRYGIEEWKKGNYLRINTSTIIHFDMFANASNIEKLIGSGAYSINDVLKAANQPEIDEEWAGMHWLTLNIGTMEAAARSVENSMKGGISNSG